MNPAGSSSVSPALSEFPLKGFLPQRDLISPRSRGEILVRLSFRTSSCFVLRFLPGFLLMKDLEAYGYGEDLANLAPRSQKPGTCSSFSEWLGKVWETLLLRSSLGMKMFPRHPLVMLSERFGRDSLPVWLPFSFPVKPANSLFWFWLRIFSFRSPSADN